MLVRGAIVFATTVHGYETCLGALHKLAHEVVANPALLDLLSAQERHLLITKVIQQQSWQEVVEGCALEGKGVGVQLMRQLVQRLLQQLAAAPFE